MSKLYTIPGETLTDIADAIRLKRDIATEIPPEDMALQVSLIDGGGGGYTVDDIAAPSGIGASINSNISAIARQYAFANFTSLTDVSLPNCTTITAHVFNGCTQLVRVYLPTVRDLGNNCFRSCSKLTEIVLPSYNSRFDASTFEGCHSLTKVDVQRLFYQSATTNALYSYALACNNLQTLIIRNTDYVARLSARTGFGAATTKMNKGEGYIYVPRSMVDAYKADSIWSTYADQIRAIEDYPEITTRT